MKSCCVCLNAFKNYLIWCCVKNVMAKSYSYAFGFFTVCFFFLEILDRIIAERNVKFLHRKPLQYIIKCERFLSGEFTNVSNVSLALAS